MTMNMGISEDMTVANESKLDQSLKQFEESLLREKWLKEKVNRPDLEFFVKRQYISGALKRKILAEYHDVPDLQDRLMKIEGIENIKEKYPGFEKVMDRELAQEFLNTYSNYYAQARNISAREFDARNTSKHLFYEISADFCKGQVQKNFEDDPDLAKKLIAEAEKQGQNIFPDKLEDLNKIKGPMGNKDLFEFSFKELNQKIYIPIAHISPGDLFNKIKYIQEINSSLDKTVKEVRKVKAGGKSV